MKDGKVIKLKLNPNFGTIKSSKRTCSNNNTSYEATPIDDKYIPKLTDNSYSTIKKRNFLSHSFSTLGDRKVYSKETEKILNDLRRFSLSGNKRIDEPKKLNKDIIAHISCEKVEHKKLSGIKNIPRPKRVDKPVIGITPRLKNLAIELNKSLTELTNKENLLNKKSEFLNKYFVFYENTKKYAQKFQSNKNFQIKTLINSVKKNLDEILIKCKRDEMIYFKDMDKITKLENEIKLIFLDGNLNNIGKRQIDFFERENEIKSILLIIEKVLGNGCHNYKQFLNEIRVELRAKRNEFVREKYKNETFAKIKKQLFEEYEIDILNKINTKFKTAVQKIYEDCKKISEKYKIYLNLALSTNIFLSNKIPKNSVQTIDDICNLLFLF
jgi:hypothetical protein